MYSRACGSVIADAGAQVAQGLAMNQFHDHGQLVLEIKRGVKLGDVDMVKGGESLHFAAEPLHHLRRALVRQQDLHGLAALRDEMLHLVDDAEAAGAELRYHFVIADPLPWFECSCLKCLQACGKYGACARTVTIIVVRNSVAYLGLLPRLLFSEFPYSSSNTMRLSCGEGISPGT